MFKRDPKTAKIGKEILPFEMDHLPDYFKKKAEIELRDTEEMREKCLPELKELIRNEKSLANNQYDDEVLLLFLLTRKYNVAKAFKQIKSYSNYKRKNIEMFTNPTFEYLVPATRDKIVSFFPWRCQDGCALGIGKIANWNPVTLPVEQLKKFYIVLFTQAMRDPMTQVNGFKVIVDLNTNPLKHLRYCTPHNLYLLYHGTQEVLPGRFKEIHCVNTNAAGRAIWYIIRPFLSEKIRKRVFFHSSTEELFDYFPRSIIPEEFGGDLKYYDSTEWLKKMMMPENLRQYDIFKLTE